MLYVFAIILLAGIHGFAEANISIYNLTRPITGSEHHVPIQILPVNAAVRGTSRRMVEVYDHCKNNGTLNIADAFMDMTLFFNINCDMQFIQEGTVVNFYTFTTHAGETLSAMVTATYAPQVTPARIIVAFDGQVAEGDLAGGMFSKLQTFDTKQVFDECKKDPGMQKIEVIHEEISVETPNGKVICTSGKGDAFFTYKPGLLFASGLKKLQYRRKRSISERLREYARRR